jgi:hypothetical protein
MKDSQFKKIIENKYSHLLMALVLFFISAPVFDRLSQFLPYTHFLLFIIIITMLRVLRVKKKIMLWLVFSGILALTLEYTSDRIEHNASDYMVALISLAYIFFLGGTIILLIRDVFREKRITMDTIKGGISIYLLLGLWWIFVYAFILMVHANAIISTYNNTLDLVSLYQFSFSTLTTVGYGNIIPVSEIAVTLSTLEAVAGQIYLTVFIARLVGLHMAGHIMKTDIPG